MYYDQTWFSLMLTHCTISFCGTDGCRIPSLLCLAWVTAPMSSSMNRPSCSSTALRSWVLSVFLTLVWEMTRMRKGKSQAQGQGIMVILSSFWYFFQIHVMYQLIGRSIICTYWLVKYYWFNFRKFFPKLPCNSVLLTSVATWCYLCNWLVNSYYIHCKLVQPSFSAK